MIFPSILTSPFYAGKIIVPAKFQPRCRHYNPSIADFQGTRWICWRVEQPDGVMNRLALGELHGLVIKKPRLIIFHGDEPNAEDPRLAVIGDLLTLQFTQVFWEAPANPEVVQRFCIILDAARACVSEDISTWSGGVGVSVTKNWTMFDRDKQLHTLEWPERGGVGNLDTLQRWPGTPCHYPFGTFSGRTPALRIGDRYLAIGGGAAPHESKSRRCYITAYTFNTEPPFEIDQISAQPLMYASDDDASTLSPRDGRHAPPTIFPCGLILDGEDLLLSAGVNDSWMCLLRIPMKKLNLQSTKLPFNNRMVHEPGRPFPPGGILVRVKVKHPVAEPGGPYLPGDTFVTTPVRAAALNHLVEVVKEDA